MAIEKFTELRTCDACAPEGNDEILHTVEVDRGRALDFDVSDEDLTHRELMGRLNNEFEHKVKCTSCGHTSREV